MPKASPFSSLTQKEVRILKKLNTPSKIQDFLNGLPFDFAPGEEIDRSVRGTLKTLKTDCAGGAVLAAAALWLEGRKPLILDLKAAPPDVDHIVALFKEGNLWGAISKTNHAVLRYREPVYRDVRELVMSYFHEYFLPNGKKTLQSFSKPFDLSRYGGEWLTNPDILIDIIYDLDHAPHEKLVSKVLRKKFRKADRIERVTGEIVEYK